jgi:hypothetical protein
VETRVVVTNKGFEADVFKDKAWEAGVEKSGPTSVVAPLFGLNVPRGDFDVSCPLAVLEY